ncbi:hypothetical protein P3S51_12215 [Acinetobacter sp. ANC 7201]|uniref:hypothetical protein n=1 Tax=Acinetobacter sp. ANC 7201 TaxID=3035288 RepID=UPI00279C6FA6|nr:hypothetical protein [Acinetobacter sp. ANC 7201]WFP96646.1 hypothetical protein P3S51_12215 [Acinetobacter sp. ANC 7201]
MTIETQGTEAIHAMITLRKCWFENDEIYLNQGCLHCGSAATYLIYFTNRKVQKLMLDFIGKFNCNPKLNFDFLDIENFSEQYEQFLSQLERLVIQYSFGKTQQKKTQSFEDIESIFERSYNAVCFA